MVPAKKLLRNVVQKIGHTFYEGPEPPKRIKAAVDEFATSCPNASQEDWHYFALQMAEECYRTGYVRGLEWSERDLERRDPAIDPDVMMEAMQNDADYEDEYGPPPIVDADAVIEDPIVGSGRNGR